LALAKLCLLPKSSPHDILIMEFVFQEETLHWRNHEGSGCFSRAAWASFFI